MKNRTLIRKFLQGDATPEEEAAFHAWLSDEQADLALIREIMSESWSDLSEEPIGEVMKEELLSTLGQKLYPDQKIHPVDASVPEKRSDPVREHSVQEDPKVFPLYSRRSLRLWTGIAASVIAVGITLFWLINKDHKADSRIADTAAIAAWKTLVNNDSRVKYAVLPDSSKVWLHPHSSLSYAMAPGAGQRAVRLQGEAFFDVQRDDQQPFLVYTGDITTKVLGTAFNVEAYTKETTIRISLVQGKVSVDQAVLHAGEMMDCNKEDHRNSRSALKIKDKEEWTKGYTILNDLSVTDALERIAGRYNLQLSYDKDVNLSGLRITTIFKKESVSQMLDILLFVSRCRYTIKGNTLEIVKK